MYYGLSKYGIANYAESIPTEEDISKDYVADLSKYVPKFIYNGEIFHETYKAQEYELGLLYWEIEDILKQCFIDSATWGLVYWEKEYGIPTNLYLSYEERREVVKAKMRGSGTCTIELIKSVSEAFSGGEVNVTENTAPYTFTVQFVGVKGIPRNMAGLKEAIDNIKPAHMLCEFKYTYTSWMYLDSKNLTWKNAESLTWDNLEIYE